MQSNSIRSLERWISTADLSILEPDGKFDGYIHVEFFLSLLYLNLVLQWLNEVELPMAHTHAKVSSQFSLTRGGNGHQMTHVLELSKTELFIFFYFQ